MSLPRTSLSVGKRKAVRPWDSDIFCLGAARVVRACNRSGSHYGIAECCRHVSLAPISGHSNGPLYVADRPIS
jgi:hypothetical protein